MGEDEPALLLPLLLPLLLLLPADLVLTLGRAEVGLPFIDEYVDRVEDSELIPR